jgi:hypothetical protein
VYYLQDVKNRPFLSSSSRPALLPFSLPPPFNETILQTDPCHSGIAASACTDAGSLTRKKPKPFADFDVLTIDQSINRSIDQSACLFDCTVFEVRIFSDGRVCHSGATFEHTGGTHECRIDRRGLTHIAQALRDAYFDEMRDSCLGATGHFLRSTFLVMWIAALYWLVSREAKVRPDPGYTDCNLSGIAYRAITLPSEITGERRRRAA